MSQNSISVSIYGAPNVFSKCVGMYFDHQFCSSFSYSISSPQFGLLDAIYPYALRESQNLGGFW